MSKTLAERLLAGEHHGCANWQEVASKLGVDVRHLRVVRKTLAGMGTPVELGTPLAGAVVGYTHEPTNSFGSVTLSSSAKPIYSNGARWPTLAEFDAASFRDETAVRNAQKPFETIASSIRKLTHADCPDGSLILWASDIHIPIHNEPVLRLMVECAERAGVRRVVAGGDILDMNCLSKHAKESRRSVEHATILEEVEPGRWLLDWFATKETTLILGNHELRLERFVDENPAFHGSVASNLKHVANLPGDIEVIDGEVRLGNLAMFHGHNEFKNGTGGRYPAQKILDMFPDQSSIHGHLHRKATAYRTTRDEDGVHRTRRAWSMGHLSLEHMHYGYVGRCPNWQIGFAIIRVYWEADRPRWTVYPIEVLFDRYNRPYFEFEGHVYR